MSTSSYSDIINHNGPVGYCETKLLQVPCIEKIKNAQHSTAQVTIREITNGKTKFYRNESKVLKQKCALSRKVPGSTQVSTRYVRVPTIEVVYPFLLPTAI